MDNILGVEELQKAFADLSSNLKKRVVRKALRAAIDIVATEILANTPEHIGLLRSSGVTKVSVNSQGTKGSASFNFGPQSLVASEVEFGHLMVGHKPGLKDLGVVPPHPFVLPAWDRSLPAAMEAFDAEFELAVVNFERPE